MNKTEINIKIMFLDILSSVWKDYANLYEIILFCIILDILCYKMIFYEWGSSFIFFFGGKINLNNF